MRAAASAGAPAAMEEIAPLEDGQYVRLVNRGRGGYLFADDTGRGVSVDHRRNAANTAWAVQILRTPRSAHVLLRGAFGRYLAVTDDAPPRPGHVGFHVAQCVFDTPNDRHIEWWTTPGNLGSVLLLHGTAGGLRALRANGRYKRWKRGVTVEAVNFSRVTSMMEWEVQVIPMRVERPPYQPRPSSDAIVSSWPATFFLATFLVFLKIGQVANSCTIAVASISCRQFIYSSYCLFKFLFCPVSPGSSSINALCVVVSYFIICSHHVLDYHFRLVLRGFCI
jgi:hypothetical protein